MKKLFLLLSLLSVSLVLQASQSGRREIDSYAAALTMVELSQNPAPFAAHPLEANIATQPNQFPSQATSVINQDQFTAPIQSKSGAGKKVRKERTEYVKNWKCSKCDKEVFGGKKDAIAKHRNSGCQKNHFRCDSLGLKDARSICPLKHADLKNFNAHLQKIHPGHKFDSKEAYDQAVAKYKGNA